MEMLKGPVDRRLWLVTVVTIAAIAGIGIFVARNTPGHAASPIALRLAAAVVVTGAAAGAKVLVGPRAAAVTGVVGVLIAVVLLIALA
jgi:hypothetical protein